MKRARLFILLSLVAIVVTSGVILGLRKDSYKPPLAMLAGTKPFQTKVQDIPDYSWNGRKYIQSGKRMQVTRTYVVNTSYRQTVAAVQAELKHSKRARFVSYSSSPYSTEFTFVTMTTPSTVPTTPARPAPFVIIRGGDRITIHEAGSRTYLEHTGFPEPDFFTRAWRWLRDLIP